MATEKETCDKQSCSICSREELIFPGSPLAYRPMLVPDNLGRYAFSRVLDYRPEDLYVGMRYI